MNKRITIGSLVMLSEHHPAIEDTSVRERTGIVLEHDDYGCKVWFCFSKYEFEPRWISFSQINILTKKAI